MTLGNGCEIIGDWKGSGKGGGGGGKGGGGKGAALSARVNGILLFQGHGRPIIRTNGDLRSPDPGNQQNQLKYLQFSGFVAWEFDYDKCSDDNILDDTIFIGLAYMIIMRLIGVLHFGTPCRSWSKARWPPLRNLFHLLEGLPGLNARGKALVAEGNELLRRTVVLITLALMLKFLERHLKIREHTSNQILYPLIYPEEEFGKINKAFH